METICLWKRGKGRVLRPPTEREPSRLAASWLDDPVGIFVPLLCSHPPLRTGTVRGPGKCWSDYPDERLREQYGLWPLPERVAWRSP
jgi:hypothetical protein